MANLKSVKNNAGPVLELGGRKRQIKFDLNGFAELENKFGSVDAAMALLTEGSMKGIRAILWAGLIHDEAVLDEDGEPISYNITPYQVGSWIDALSMEKIMEALNTALTGDLPESEATQEPVALSLPTVDEEGHQIATVVLTEEEKAEEAKNV